MKKKIKMNLLDQKLSEIEEQEILLEIEKIKVLCAKMLVDDFYCIEKTAWNYARIMDIDNGEDLLKAISDIPGAEKEVMFYIDKINELKKQKGTKIDTGKSDL